MNLIILMGRLAKDPNIRYSRSNEPFAVASFSVATMKAYRKEGEPDAVFVPCVAFGKTAETIEKYFKKGTQVVIQGKWDTNIYTKDGKKTYQHQVLVDKFEFCGSRKDNAQDSLPSMPGNFTPVSDNDIPDDLPW